MTARPGTAPGQAAHAAACAHEGIDDADEVAELWQGLGDSGRAHWADVSQAAVTEFIDERATTAAAAAQPASGGLRAALVETLADWRDDATYHPNDTRDEITEHYAVTRCADRLADILRDHPEQPAPAAAPSVPRLTRHDGHDPSMICRPAGNGLCELWTVTQEPAAAPGVGALTRKLDRYREGIEQLLADVTASADTTRPSAKTRAEDALAEQLRQLLEQP